jgi:hypothetical protein
MKITIALLLLNTCTAIVLRAPGSDLKEVGDKLLDSEKEQELEQHDMFFGYDKYKDASTTHVASCETSEDWDAIERLCEEQAVLDFKPSERLIEEWTGKSKAVSLKIAESDMTEKNLPEQCRLEIMKKQKKHEECRDPWIKTKNCHNSYEIPNYRMGDLFYQFLCFTCNAQYTQWYFPKSIGAEYWKAHKHPQDYDAMKQVILSDEYKSYERPDKKTLVLHVRGFDVMTVHKTEKQYRKGDSYYQKVAKVAAKEGFDKVVIVTGDHWLSQVNNLQNGGKNGTLDKTAQVKFAEALQATSYRVQTIAKIFSDENLYVTKRQNWNADCDFIFMANAKGFVPSGGTFDHLVTEMVKRLDGKIISPK